MKTFIFDLGNVLFKADFNKTVNFWSARAKIHRSEISSRLVLGSEFRAFERGEISPHDFFTCLCARLDIDLSPNMLVRGWNAIYGPVITQSFDAVKTLSKLTSVVALTNTNATHCDIWKSLYERELKVFQRIYVSSDIGMRKPEKRIFEYVLNDLNLTAGDAVFFDDVPENITAARETGIQAILVDSDDVVSEWINEYLKAHLNID